MSISTTILLHTKTLPALELERLALSNCRCPNLENQHVRSIQDVIDDGILTKEFIGIILDISDMTYYQNGEFTYVKYQFRNIEQLITCVMMDNAYTAEGELTGLIESDTSELTMMYVIPSSVVLQHAQLQQDVILEATKRAFYL